VLAVYESVVPFFFFLQRVFGLFFLQMRLLGYVGWSKAYLQLTHTTCLTKYKPKRNKKKTKQNKTKRTKNRFCRGVRYVFYYFYFLSGQIQVYKMRRFSNYQGKDNKIE
jgi:hypothetical protein